MQPGEAEGSRCTAAPIAIGKCGLCQVQLRPAEVSWGMVRNLYSVMRRGLRPLRFAPYPLGNPHPQLRLVAYRLRSRDVLRRGDLFGGQTQ